MQTMYDIYIDIYLTPAVNRQSDFRRDTRRASSLKIYIMFYSETCVQFLHHLMLFS